MFDYINIKAVDAGTVTEPVILDEAKAWLKVDYPDDDAVITGLIKGARQTIEQLTSLALVAKSVVVVVETTKAERIKIPYGTASGLVVTDRNDATLEADEDYFLKEDMIHLPNSGIYYLAYSVAPSVPEALKEAVLMEVAKRYDNKGEAKEGIREAARERAIQFSQGWL